MHDKPKKKFSDFATANGKSHKKTPRLVLINKLLACFILAAGVYFVASINDLSVKGFILDNLKKKITALANENNNSELKIMKLESYDNLRNRALDLKMVKVDRIDYLTVTSDAMAKK